MTNYPNWFNENEYADFLAESSILWEMMNVPYQKQKVENRKKMMNFEREKAIQKGRLKGELMRDLYRKKAQGIQQMQQRLGEGIFDNKIEEIQNSFFASLLAEAESKRTPLKREKTKMRPEVDPKDRDRDRKREARKQEKQSGLANVIIVKNNKLNKVEIITKQDYNPNTHTVLKGKVKKVDKGNVTKRDLTYYSSLENFMNTKTSVKLLGGRVERKQEKKEKTKSSKPEQKQEQPTPPRPRVPQNGKEMTDPTSTFPEWDHSTSQIVSGADDALNALSGKQPSAEYQQFISTSRTYGDAMQRFAKEIYSAFPAAASMVFSKPDPVVKTSKEWSKMGIKESAPTATIVGESEQGTMGVSIKIGQQMRPLPKGEINPIFNMILATSPSQPIIGSFDMFVKDFIEDLKKASASQSIPLALQNNKESSAALAREKWKIETTQNTQKSFLNRAAQVVENYINENYDLKATILLEALTGNMKFGGKTGSAQMMFTAKKDGTNARAIPLDMNFALTLAKSKDTDLNIKFDPTPNTSNGFLQNMFGKINPLMEGSMGAIGDIESIKNQLTTPAAFLQMFELRMSDATYKMPIEYCDFYGGDSDISNTVVFNANTASEEQIDIPVQKNYDPQGDEENVVAKGADALLEEYLLLNDTLVENIKTGNIDLLEAIILMEEEFGLSEARNYRKEYDNYHSKKKQRKNRSKRVMARRKMIKKGKVRKGDGKDVHHADGNPQNNNDGNLKVLSKSKNRSMNEDHGAGFEGTPEVVEKLLSVTPFSNFPPVGKGSVPYLEAQLDKKKKQNKK